jgi:peptidyl-tRNA hydrolase
LYIVVRSDLSPGLQASQAVHVAHQFALDYQDAFEEWHRTSNTVVIVAALDADALGAVHAQAISAAVQVSAFSDDDIPGSRLTALALGPCPAAKRICQPLPLALQRKEQKAA